jgi:hypothetical protein
MVQEESQINNDNLKHVRNENNRHFRNKRREYLKDKINELETECKNIKKWPVLRNM